MHCTCTCISYTGMYMCTSDMLWLCTCFPVYPLQIFEYQSVVRNTGFTNHFPVHEMSCAAKLRYNFQCTCTCIHHFPVPLFGTLSCIAYNPYHKHHLVSSDYEGSVCVWDTNIGRRTALHQVCECPLSLSCVYSDVCTVGTWPSCVVGCLQPSGADPLCLWQR